MFILIIFLNIFTPLLTKDKTDIIMSYEDALDICGELRFCDENLDEVFKEAELLKLVDRDISDNIEYVILHNGKSFAEQVIKENTIYEIRSDFDLGGFNENMEATNIISIPNNCILLFNGGNLSNGKIVCNNTKIEGEYQFHNVIIDGTINLEEINAKKYTWDSDTKLLYYIFKITGVKRILLDSRIYYVDSRLINDTPNTFVFIQDDVQIDGLGCHIIDARGNADLLHKKSYFYFFRSMNSSNVVVENINFSTDDSIIEIDVDGEMETFGEGFILFTNCKNYSVNNCKFSNLSVGVSCNETFVEYDDSSSIQVQIDCDNVGYMLMVNGENNINADIIARTHTHRVVYSGGSQNSKYEIKILDKFSATASCVILQEYWKQDSIGRYVFSQNSNVQILINCYCDVAAGSMVMHGYYESDVHSVIAKKNIGYVMDDIDITINYHVVQSNIASAFTSEIVTVLPHNTIYKGRVSVNMLQDTIAPAKDLIYIACGSTIYNNVDFDLDVELYSQNKHPIKVRTTNLSSRSVIRINSNSDISGLCRIVSSMKDVEGVGTLYVNAPKYIINERIESAGPNIKMINGSVDKTMYRSAVGVNSIETNDYYVVTDANNYQTAIKTSDNIIIKVSDDFILNENESFKNYSAKNETYNIIVKNVGEQDIFFKNRNFEVSDVSSVISVTSGKELMVQVMVVDGITHLVMLIKPSTAVII